MYIYRYTPRDVWGINNFKLFLEEITGMNPAKLKAVCKWLDVSEKTLSRWLSEATPVPRAVCYAMFHESKYGRSLAETTAFNDRQFLTSKIERQEQRINALEADNAALRDAAASSQTHHAANDAIYTNKPFAAPAKRRSSPPVGFKIGRRWRG